MIHATLRKLEQMTGAHGAGSEQPELLLDFDADPEAPLHAGWAFLPCACHREALGQCCAMDEHAFPSTWRQSSNFNFHKGYTVYDRKIGGCSWDETVASGLVCLRVKDARPARPGEWVTISSHPAGEQPDEESVAALRKEFEPQGLKVRVTTTEIDGETRVLVQRQTPRDPGLAEIQVLRGQPGGRSLRQAQTLTLTQDDLLRVLVAGLEA